MSARMTEQLLIVKNSNHEGAGILETVLSYHGIASHSIDLSTGEMFPDPQNYRALVVLGGPQSANDKTVTMQNEIQQIKRALDAEIPFLGICLGMQSLVKAGGGMVMKCPVKETGFLDADGLAYRMELTSSGKESPLFNGLAESIPVFQLHGETVQLTASGMTLLATGRHCPIQAVKVGKNAYGLQCHAELTYNMFREWCGIDTDLKRMDKVKLFEQFDALHEEYTTTGVKLINNFLQIAGIA
ncbi:MAG: type 1 glutamine amidotransferase [Chlorobiaceae bacterium]